MQTVRFINLDRTQFTTVLRKNVTAYFKANNTSTKGGPQMIWKAIIMLSLYLAPFIVMLTVQMPNWMIFPLAFIMGVGMAGVGMSVMHDAAHGSFSNKGWLNDLAGGTIYLIGSNLLNWKIQHNLLHHTYTNLEGLDEDINTKAKVVRLSRHAPLRKIHRFQYLYVFLLYGLMTISKLFGDFGQLLKYNRKGLTVAQKAIPRREFIKMTTAKIIYMFVAIGLPMLVTDFPWWLILLGFLVVHATAGAIMSVIFQLAHVVEGADQPPLNKEGNIDNEWAVHELLTTANFSKNNRLLGWYIGGLNFQIEHHLFPHICHIHYKKISHIVEQTAKEFGLPYNQKVSFGDALMSHIRMLKELGRQAILPAKISHT